MIEVLAERALLTHLCHDVDHAAEPILARPKVSLAYDGLVEVVDE